MDVVFHKGHLAREVQEILELTGGNNEWTTPGAKIVTVIINAIVKALQKGDRVTIQGFGTFSIKVRKPKPLFKRYFYKDKGKHGKWGMTKATPYVHFKATDSLKKFVSQPIIDQEKNESQS